MKAYHIIRPYKDHISDNYFVSKTKQKKTKSKLYFFAIKNIHIHQVRKKS